MIQYNLPLPIVTFPVLVLDASPFDFLFAIMRFNRSASDKAGADALLSFDCVASSQRISMIVQSMRNV
jgi:hypothetical protein